MRASVFGLGYVGTVTMACLARDGHEMFGVDVNADKVAALAAGQSPIAEPGLSDLLAQAAQRGNMHTTTSVREAISSSEVSLISVGTPSRTSGQPDLSYVDRVCQEIGQAVRTKRLPHTVVIRSTVPPGTTAKCAAVLQELASPAGVHVAFNPEFLREGSAIVDYDNPPYTVVGTEDAKAEANVRELYSGVDAPVHVVTPAVAELVKYTANAWHAAKIVFANEIGRIAKQSGVDGREVMEIIVQDAKLNVSPAYMRPGFAYGGSCLPKDVRAILFQARHHDIQVPLLSALPISNKQQIDAAVAAVLSRKPRRVAVLGLAFKSDTDDLRESPAVVLVKRLIGEGCEVAVYASDVDRSRIMGANLSYIREHLPHFEALMVDELDALLEWGEVIVATNADDSVRQALANRAKDRAIIDVAGLFPPATDMPDYFGIAW
jgi:GDP-mannose 6-dehydrogenase